MRTMAWSRWAGFVLLPLLGAAAAGCGGETAETGVLLRIDADHETRGRVRRLEVEVFAWSGLEAPASGGEPVKTLQIEVRSSEDWPKRGALRPPEGKSGRFFRVVVRGYEAGADEPLVLARAESGYVPGQWRQLSLWLVSRCYDVSCPEGETCDNGRCFPAWQDPQKLPEADPDAGTPTNDAGMPLPPVRCLADGHCAELACGSCERGVCGEDGYCACGPRPDGTSCTLETNSCQVGQCVAGRCEASAAPDGTPCEDDDNECTVDVCSSGLCAHEPRDRGASCSGGYCDGMGACRGCLEASHCASTSCGACQEPTCLPDGTCGCDPVADDTPCEDDGMECTTDVCRSGACEHLPKPERTECAAGLCASDGTCKECLVDDDCAASCGPCQVATCTDSGCACMPVADGTDCDCGVCSAGECVARFQGVAVGSAHTCALDQGGGLWCWGANDYGQLGLGDTMNRSEPSRLDAPGAGLSWRQVAAGSQFACAVSSDERAYCWGRGREGRLGLGSTTDRSSPSRLGLSGVRQVATGWEHACALTGPEGARRIYCWGDNYEGELGLGDSTNRTSPVRLSFDFGAPLTLLGAGAHYSCAGHGSGLWCWGANGDSRLGNSGLTTWRSYSTPQDVSVLGGVRRLAVGAYGGCAVGLDNRAYCWGDGAAIGNGDTVDQSAPARVDDTEMGTVRDIARGVGSACAIDTMRRLWCWGKNDSGQLGLGDTAARNVPARIEGALAGKQVSQVAVGGRYRQFSDRPMRVTTCAVTMDGELYCWGDNEFGQLGQGDTTNRTEPVRVRARCM